MVNLVRIDACELPELIRFTYTDDLQGLLKYYKLPKEVNSIEEAVDCTLGMINSLELDHYKIMFGETVIGYSSICENCLYSFAINKWYRSDLIKQRWFEKVKELLGSKFMVVLYSENIRAIRYLESQGMELVLGVDENMVTLINN